MSDTALSDISDDSIGVILSFLQFEDLKDLIFLKVFHRVLNTTDFWNLYLLAQYLPLENEFQAQLAFETTPRTVLLHLRDKQFLLSKIYEMLMSEREQSLSQRDYSKRK